MMKISKKRLKTKLKQNKYLGELSGEKEEKYQQKNRKQSKEEKIGLNKSNFNHLLFFFRILD